MARGIELQLKIGLMNIWMHCAPFHSKPSLQMHSPKRSCLNDIAFGMMEQLMVVFLTHCPFSHLWSIMQSHCWAFLIGIALGMRAQSILPTQASFSQINPGSLHSHLSMLLKMDLAPGTASQLYRQREPSQIYLYMHSHLTARSRPIKAYLMVLQLNSLSEEDDIIVGLTKLLGTHSLFCSTKPSRQIQTPGNSPFRLLAELQTRRHLSPTQLKFWIHSQAVRETFLPVLNGIFAQLIALTVLVYVMMVWLAGREARMMIYSHEVPFQT